MTTLNKILTIVESKGKAREVGFAFIDLSIKTCSVGQFSDTYTNTGVLRHVLKLEPDLILLQMDESQSISSSSRLPNSLHQKFPSLPMDYIDKNTSHTHSDYITFLEKHCLTQKIESLKLVLSKKFYCQSAMIGLFNYLSKQPIPQGISFFLDSCDGCTLIDFYSIQNLELIRSIDGKGSSLLSSINNSLTPMGTRILRQNIIQPPMELSTIQFRQKMVQFFLSSNVLLEEMRSALNEMPDLDGLCSKIEQQQHVSTKNILSNLKTFLELMNSIKLSKKIAKLFGNANDGISKNNTNDIIEDHNFLIIKGALSSEHLDSIYGNLLKVLDDKAMQGTAQRISDYQLCNLIRRGINSLLDVAHQTMEETIEDLMEYSKIFSSESGIGIKVKWNNQHRFIWTLNHGNSNNTTNIEGGGETEEEEDQLQHLKPIKSGNTILGWTNIELQKFNERIQESIEEIGSLSETTIWSLRKLIQEKQIYLLQMNEAISLLDMIQGFSQFSIEQRHCSTPIFTTKTNFLLLEDAYHPILTRNRPTSLRTDSSLNLVTGNNMSGKSCLIKQIVLLQIMAQIGMNLPVAKMKTRTFSSIFTRIGSDDDLMSNASTFAVEMREISYMIEEGSPDSLIIIDELGRGTSVADGLALTTAICEYLLKRGSFTFFVTHFPPLISYLRTFEDVNHYPLESNVTIVDLALNSNIPSDVITDYRRIKMLLEEDSCEQINLSLYKKKEKKRIILKYCNLLFEVLEEEDENENVNEGIKKLSEQLLKELDRDIS